MKKFPFLKTLNIYFATALSISFGLAAPVFAEDHSYLIDLASKKVADLAALQGHLTFGINILGR